MNQNKTDVRRGRCEPERFKEDLAAVRLRLAALASSPTAGARTRKLYGGGGTRKKPTHTAVATLATAASGVTPRMESSMAALSHAVSLSSVSDRSTQHQLFGEFLFFHMGQTLALLDRQATAAAAAAAASSGPGQGGRAGRGSVSGDASTRPPSSSGNGAGGTSSSSHRLPFRRSSTSTLRPPDYKFMLKSKDIHDLLANTKCLPSTFWARVLWRAAADVVGTPRVVAARREMFRRELEATNAMLRARAIKAPINAARHQAERRLNAARADDKRRLQVIIFLRTHPVHDLRIVKLRRRQKFEEAVDRTMAFLSIWEQSQQTSRKMRESKIAQQEGSRWTTPLMTPSAIGRPRRILLPDLPEEFAQVQSPMGPRLSMSGTFGSAQLPADQQQMPHTLSLRSDMEKRRMSRRASLAEAAKAVDARPARTATSIIDVRGLLSKPYDGPVVQESYRAARAREARAAERHASSPSPSRRRSRSPGSRLSITRNSLESGGMFSWSPAALSPIGQTTMTPLAPHSEVPAATSPAGSVGSQQPKCSAALLSRGSRAARCAGDPTPEREGSKKKKTKERGTAAIGRITSPAHSNAVPPHRLAPLPREVQVAAATRRDADGPSSVLDQLVQQHHQLIAQSVQAKRSVGATSVALLLGEAPRPIDRTTASMRLRTLSPQVLSFFDEKGLIDGRPRDAGHDVSAREGTAYSVERIAAVRRQAEQAERRRVHRRRGDVTPDDDAHDDDANAPQERRAGGDALGQSDGDTTGLKHPNDRASSLLSSMRRNGAGDGRQTEMGPERLRELLATVFVRGGEVGTFLRKLEREAQMGLKRPDVRRSNKDRLGGGSVPRSVL